MPKRKLGRGWRIAAWLLVLLGLIMFFRWFENCLVYHPRRAHDADPSALGRRFEEVWLNTSDGLRVHGWFFPANPGSDNGTPAILYCHGNGGNISHRLDVIEALLETDAAVLAFDYRGYGLSNGRPGEQGTYRDGEAALDWLAGRGFPGTNVVVFGESLGGGVASELARRRPLGALVLQSTFTSIPDIGAELYPWLPVRFITSIRYDTIRRLPELRLPVVILHSRSDTLIRFAHAEKNFAAAREPKWLIELSGDHNDSLTDRDAFVAGVQRAMDQLEDGTGAR
jgi:fermentation-respiration switch protein FrsA (DUF1100 family)